MPDAVQNVLDLEINLQRTIGGVNMNDNFQKKMMKLRSDIEEALSDFIYHFADDIPKDSPAYQQIREDFINALCTGS